MIGEGIEAACGGGHFDLQLKHTADVHIKIDWRDAGGQICGVQQFVIAIDLQSFGLRGGFFALQQEEFSGETIILPVQKIGCLGAVVA